MNHVKNKIAIGLVLVALLAGACSKSLLTETPRNLFTPAYFQTADGVQAGLTSLYQNLRQVYGLYYYVACEQGTDEYTYGTSGDNNNLDNDLTQGIGANITPTTSRSDVLWNNVYSNINTANGIIQYGGAAGVANSLIAEAKFFRAFDYFMLVQTFGGVPLDLGSGVLQFNINAVSVSVRNTVPEVYTKAIFPDLLIAVDSLPDAGRVTGGATKTLARLYLAKAYLTYAWWLQNPNGIPTYPDASRTDPDGHNAAWYFQQAYNIATTAIANPGSFGLQPTYYNVNVGSNDRNNEILLYADHTQSSEYYNDGETTGSLSYANGTPPENDDAWFTTWNSGTITSQNGTANVSSVQREAAQWGGRPWSRMAPPVGVIINTFADKTNDSRYDGTFATVFRGNWNKSGSTVPSNVLTLTNANGMQVAPGDAILSFLNADNAGVVYPTTAGSSSVGAGTLPSRADYVINPSGISRGVYPNLWKIGTYRTDNNGGLGQPNGTITRPWNIAKFSELFFIAAEAAVEGASPQAVSGAYANDGSAKGLINIIRSRAGKWSFSNALNQSVTVDNSAAMVAATPAAIDINYILAERSREYFGEGYRWYDLVRTQTWAQIAKTYSICGTSYGTSTTDHNLQTYTRTIDNHYYLRPIPQTQIDGLTVDAATKSAYQNPGY